MTEIIPISDEQAKLLQEAIKALDGFGGFLRETLGTLPSDIVGMLGGDYLRVRRAENISKMIGKAKRRLEASGIEHPDAPPRLAIPIMQEAANESRDELLDVWAALLAAAADPAKAKFFRARFIQIASRLDPMDALVLKQAATLGEGELIYRDDPGDLITETGITNDQARVSFLNLLALDLMQTEGHSVLVSPLGREFLRAVE